MTDQEHGDNGQSDYYNLFPRPADVVAALSASEYRRLERLAERFADRKRAHFISMAEAYEDGELTEESYARQAGKVCGFEVCWFGDDRRVRRAWLKKLHDGRFEVGAVEGDRSELPELKVCHLFTSFDRAFESCCALFQDVYDGQDDGLEDYDS